MHRIPAGIAGPGKLVDNDEGENHDSDIEREEKNETSAREFDSRPLASSKPYA